MSKATNAPAANVEWALENVAEALRGLRYGTVTLTVQDGIVVQVERVEKRRFQTRAGGDRDGRGVD
jgi:hypothetical protein